MRGKEREGMGGEWKREKSRGGRKRSKGKKKERARTV